MSDLTTLNTVKRAAELAVMRTLIKLDEMGMVTAPGSLVRITAVGALECFVEELEAAMRNPRSPP